MHNFFDSWLASNLWIHSNPLALVLDDLHSKRVKDLLHLLQHIYGDSYFDEWIDQGIIKHLELSVANLQMGVIDLKRLP